MGEKLTSSQKQNKKKRIKISFVFFFNWWVFICNAWPQNLLRIVQKVLTKTVRLEIGITYTKSKKEWSTKCNNFAFIKHKISWLGYLPMQMPMSCTRPKKFCFHLHVILHVQHKFHHYQKVKAIFWVENGENCFLLELTNWSAAGMAYFGQ